MTHKWITEKASKWLKKHEQNIIIPNCSTVVSELTSAVVTGEIPDVIGWCSWTSVLLEVKTSRPDFLRDKKKKFKEQSDLGMGEFRYYICPEGLIDVVELPINWGLLYIAVDGGISIIQKADKQVSNLKCERTVLLSLIRRSK